MIDWLIDADADAIYKRTLVQDSHAGTTVDGNV